MNKTPKLSIIANMYAARKKLKDALKERYAPALAPIIADLRRIMAAHQCNEIQAAMMLTSAISDEKDPMRRKKLGGFIWSGALEIDEQDSHAKTN